MNVKAIFYVLVVLVNFTTLTSVANTNDIDVTPEIVNLNQAQNRNPSSSKKLIRISRTSTTSHFVEVDVDFPEDHFDQLQIEIFDSQG